MWVWMIVGLTIIAGAFSIYGSWQSWRDIQSGHPTYLSLVDYLGISRPAEMIDHFGECDADGRFELSDDDLGRLPRAWWMIIVDDPKTDLALMLLAIAGGVLHDMGESAGLPLVMLAAGWMLLSYVIAGWVVLQHPQLRE